MKVVLADVTPEGESVAAEISKLYGVATFSCFSNPQAEYSHQTPCRKQTLRRFSCSRKSDAKAHHDQDAIPR